MNPLWLNVWEYAGAPPALEAIPWPTEAAAGEDIAEDWGEPSRRSLRATVVVEPDGAVRAVDLGPQAREIARGREAERRAQEEEAGMLRFRQAGVR